MCQNKKSGNNFQIHSNYQFTKFQNNKNKSQIIMRHSYKILVFFCLITTISNGQISQYSKLAKVEPVTDLGFENFARAAQALSNRVVFNNNQSYSLAERVQEVYENKLDEGCDSDFQDLYLAKLGIILDKVNSGKIDITTSNGFNIYKAEMTSLERELNRYNCSQKSSSNTEVSQFNSYGKTPSVKTTNTIVNKTIPMKKVIANCILWSDCDINKREPVVFVDKGSIANVMNLCENRTNNQYYVILENGKAGYLGYNDLEN